VSPPQSRFFALSRAELAIMIPELLLIGQLIDRSGMAWCIQSFGRSEMLQIAIEEWSGASPLYTRRMQKALCYSGDDVITIFKGLQLDIGAPPQFMDFRYTVTTAAPCLTWSRWGQTTSRACATTLRTPPSMRLQ